jgi:hypothetical protein
VFCRFFAVDLKDFLKFNFKKLQLPPGFILNGFGPFCRAALPYEIPLWVK